MRQHQAPVILHDTAEHRLRPRNSLSILTKWICATKCGASTVSPYFHLFEKYFSNYTSRDSASAHMRPRSSLNCIGISSAQPLPASVTLSAASRLPHACDQAY